MIRRPLPFLALPVALVLVGGCDDAAKPIEHTQHQIEVRDHAQGVAAEATAGRLMQSYMVKHGGYPGSIQELEASEGRLPAPPPGKRWHLDPRQGKLTLR